MSNTWKAIVSLQSSLVRLGRGAVVKGHRKAPELPLEFYDAEYCPHCRYVREALTELDLDALVHPVPKDGKRFSPVLQEQGGKATVPFLYDPNTGRKLYESKDIVRYLYAEYGVEDRRPPLHLLALAVRHDGMFVTFDGSIVVAAIRGAGKRHLAVL